MEFGCRKIYQILRGSKYKNVCMDQNKGRNSLRFRKSKKNVILVEIERLENFFAEKGREAPFLVSE